MSFGIRGTYNFAPLVVLFAILVQGCPAPSGTIHERFLVYTDKGWVLRGHEESDDKPLDYCKGVLCRVYDDDDVRKIEKYVVSLEEQLKECQKKQ